MTQASEAINSARVWNRDRQSRQDWLCSSSGFENDHVRDTERGDLCEGVVWSCGSRNYSQSIVLTSLNGARASHGCIYHDLSLSIHSNALFHLQSSSSSLGNMDIVTTIHPFNAIIASSMTQYATALP